METVKNCQTAGKADSFRAQCRIYTTSLEFARRGVAMVRRSHCPDAFEKRFLCRGVSAAIIAAECQTDRRDEFLRRRRSAIKGMSY